MQAPPTQLRAAGLVQTGLVMLFRPPFVLLLAVSVLIFAVTQSISAQVDDAAVFGVIVLSVLSAFVQIAMTMAAGSNGPASSADMWLKRALRGGVFWRFVLTGVVSVMVVLLGLLVLLIGGFLAGALIALAQPASVQERLWPPSALRRSIGLSQGNRVPLGIVFGVLVILPNGLAQAAATLRWDVSLGAGWYAIGLATVVLNSAAVVALTKAYVELGGKATPAPGGAEA